MPSRILRSRARRHGRRVLDTNDHDPATAPLELAELAQTRQRIVHRTFSDAQASELLDKLSARTRTRARGLENSNGEGPRISISDWGSLGTKPVIRGRDTVPKTPGPGLGLNGNRREIRRSRISTTVVRHGSGGQTRRTRLRRNDDRHKPPTFT